MFGEDFVSETTGNLTSCDPECVQTDGTYRVAYRVTRESLSMESCSDASYRLVFPVRTAVVDDVCMVSPSKMQIEDTARHGDAFSPIGGFLTRYMMFLPDENGKCLISIK